MTDSICLYLKFVPRNCAAFITWHGRHLNTNRWYWPTILANEFDHCESECDHWYEVTTTPRARLGRLRRWWCIGFIIDFFAHFTGHFNSVGTSCCCRCTTTVRIERIQPVKIERMEINHARNLAINFQHTHLNITSIQSAVLSSASTRTKFSESELISLWMEIVSLISSDIFVLSAESMDVIKLENPFFMDIKLEPMFRPESVMEFRFFAPREMGVEHCVVDAVVAVDVNVLTIWTLKPCVFGLDVYCTGCACSNCW